MPNERRFRIKPAPVVSERFISAPREMVWSAWSEAGGLQRWFAPEGFEIIGADVDFRAGGDFSFELRTPFGQQLVSNGEYTEIAAPNLIAFRSGDRKFMSQTTVSFIDDGTGTRLTIQQSYEVYAPGFLAVAAGAADAWRTTLDKLEREIENIRAAKGAS